MSDISDAVFAFELNWTIQIVAHIPHLTQTQLQSGPVCGLQTNVEMNHNCPDIRNAP